LPLSPARGKPAAEPFAAGFRFNLAEAQEGRALPPDISELMLHDVAMVPRDASVQEAARAMAESDCRVVLIGEDGAVEGMLTERDVLIRVVAAGLPPGGTAVSSVMSAELFTCREDQAVDEAAAEMAEHRVSQLPVLDREGRLVGLLPQSAVRDIAGATRGERVDGEASVRPAEPAD
jgi:CBS domain-containing protein